MEPQDIFKYIQTPDFLWKSIIFPILTAIIFPKLKEYINLLPDKQAKYKKFDDIRSAYKENIDILLANKEMSIGLTIEDKNIITLHRNSLLWMYEVITSTPEGRGRDSLLNLDPYGSASDILMQNKKDEKALPIPPFYKTRYYIISILGFLVGLIFYLMALFFLVAFVQGILWIHLRIISGENILTIIWYISICTLAFLYMVILPVIGAAIYTLMDAIPFKISGSVLADIFYRQIAHNNFKETTYPNYAVRANRIRASYADKKIREYVDIPQSSRKILRILGFHKTIPTLPFINAAIVRATNYGYIKGLEDEYKKDLDVLESHKISKFIIDFLNLQDSTTEEE